VNEELEDAIESVADSAKSSRAMLDEQNEERKGQQAAKKSR